MRRIALATFCLIALCLGACAPRDEETRATMEAGGTLPWNKPASWEGQGALGGGFQGTR